MYYLWGFNHFLVVEGFQGEMVYLSDTPKGASKLILKNFQQTIQALFYK